jgi:membrane fusion protein
MQIQSKSSSGASRSAVPNGTFSLFRPAAVRSHARRLDGEVLLIQPMSVYLVLAVLGAFAAVGGLFLGTASYSRLERVTGYLVPRDGVSTILPTRAGLVSEVVVRPGDHVQAGQVLVRVGSQAALEDGANLEQRLEDSLRLQLEELQRKLALADAKLALGQEKRRRDLAQLDERAARLRELDAVSRDRLTLARRRESALAELLTREIISEKQYQEHRDIVLGLEGQLRQGRYAALELDDRRRALEAELELQPTSVADEKADLRIRMLALESELRELEGRSGFALVSPVAGRVASLQATAGSEVRPGVPVAVVIPEASALEAHLLVPTRAAGLIRAGQHVGIKYAAFPYQTFGTRSGTIHRIDTAVLAPEQVHGPVAVQEPVYRVVAELDHEAIDALGGRYPLQPGMQLEADIVLESRSFMTWILEPLQSRDRGRH